MNVLSGQRRPQIDWVINYVEVNSQPVTADEFRLLRITNSELRIDPAGIVLSISQTTDCEIQLQNGSESYGCSIVQRGNELVVKISRCNAAGDIMIVAKERVSEFPAAPSFPRTSQVAASGKVTSALNNEPFSFF